jgi:hypothetical protein
MFLHNTTPDGTFELEIHSADFEEADAEIPAASLLQLVELLERTAQTLRLAVDPDLQRTPGSDR